MRFVDFICKIFTKIKTIILDLLFPIECIGCANEGEWLCKHCFRKIKISEKLICTGCKKESLSGSTCTKCRINYSLDGALVVSFYNDKLTQKLVKSLKYYFASDIAKILGKLLNLYLRDTINKSRYLKIQNKSEHFFDFFNATIIPVPLHPKRERWRGFNQSELLAKAVSKYLNIPISTDKLIRTKHKKAQAKIAKHNRINNIKGCFKWTGKNLKGKNIIIIDDIITTGATINEIAKVLKQNGAGDVWGLAVARG